MITIKYNGGTPNSESPRVTIVASSLKNVINLRIGLDLFTTTSQDVDGTGVIVTDNNFILHKEGRIHRKEKVGPSFIKVLIFVRLKGTVLRFCTNQEKPRGQKMVTEITKD